MNRRLLEYVPQMELPAAPRQAAAQQQEADNEMAYAAELLEARNGAQLQAFLAELADACSADAGGAPLTATPAGPPLVAALARAAQPLFPLHGSGGSLALRRKAARIFGLELEGLSPEDKEFEVARHFVRFAADTIRGVPPDGGADPQTAVQSALVQAARRHAPGLLHHAASRPARGRWQRQGDVIVVLNC